MLTLVCIFPKVCTLWRTAYDSLVLNYTLCQWNHWTFSSASQNCQNQSITKEIKRVSAERCFSEGTEINIFEGTRDFGFTCRQLYNFMSGKCKTRRSKFIWTTAFSYLSQSYMYSSGRLKLSGQIRVNITPLIIWPYNSTPWFLSQESNHWLWGISIT